MKALLIILIILTILALLPVGVDGGYRNNTVVLGVKVAFLNLKLFPKKQKQPKAKKQKKAVEIPETAVKTEEKKKKSFDIKQMLAIMKPALKALSTFRRKLTIDYFLFHCTIASDDPADTAIAYGGANAIAGAVIPLVENAFDVRNRDIGFSMDFLSEKPQIEIWLTATIQIWELIYIAGAFGVDLLKLQLKNRKARNKERIETDGQTSDR